MLLDEVGPKFNKDQAPQVLDERVLKELIPLPNVVLLEDLEKGHPDLLKMRHDLAKPRIADEKLLVDAREQEKDHRVECLGIHKLVRKVQASHKGPNLLAHDIKINLMHSLCLYPLAEKLSHLGAEQAEKRLVESIFFHSPSVRQKVARGYFGLLR
jgi:hypothetical protein